MTATEQRNRAAELAVSDPDRALVIARRLKNPWFACQALASVARFAPEHQLEEIINESLRAGSKADDPYKIVASAAWPIRALVERNHSRRLESIIPQLLDLAKTIELFASRSEALFLVFQAVFPAGREWWLDVFQAIISASNPLINWRQKRNLRDTILIVWSEDQELASASIADVLDIKLKGQIEKRIADSDLSFPRRFF